MPYPRAMFAGTITLRVTLDINLKEGGGTDGEETRRDCAF